MIDSVQLDMLHEASFEPCWVRDVREGDTIAIEHPSNPGVPTEMVVGPTWYRTFDDGYIVRYWIGALSNGQSVHCSYGESVPTWRLTGGE